MPALSFCNKCVSTLVVAISCSSISDLDNPSYTLMKLSTVNAELALITALSLDISICSHSIMFPDAKCLTALLF